MPRDARDAALSAVEVFRESRIPEEMSDTEAEALLRIADLRARDPLMRRWEDPPVDDEPWTDADDAAAAEGDEDVASGHVVEDGSVSSRRRPSRR